MLECVMIMVIRIIVMTFNILNWIEVDKILVPNFGPASQLLPVFFNTPPALGPAVNTWTTADISDYVAPNTVAIHLTGLLLLTHGTTAETADLRLHFRRDSSQGDRNYIHQVVETSTTGGQRSPMACWIPLTDAKTFDWKWNTQHPPGTYPAFSAYGANLQIDAIGIKG